MQCGIGPKKLNKLEDCNSIITNMLLDNSNEDSELLEVVFLMTDAVCISNSGREGWNDLPRDVEKAIGRSVVVHTCGKNATHLKPWVLKIDMIASTTAS